MMNLRDEVRIRRSHHFIVLLTVFNEIERYPCVSHFIVFLMLFDEMERPMTILKAGPIVPISLFSQCFSTKWEAHFDTDMNMVCGTRRSHFIVLLMLFDEMERLTSTVM